MSSRIVAIFDNELHQVVVPLNTDADQLRDANDKLAAAERRIAELEAERAIAARKLAVVSKPAGGAIDMVATHLSEVVRLAQGLTEEDSRRRIRDLVHATSSVLLASTYLPADDQRLFESALRTAAGKK
jgi:transcriptional regulator of met regulon